MNDPDSIDAQYAIPKFIANSFIFFGFLYFSLSILFLEVLRSIFGLMVIIMGNYLKKRFVRVKLIGNEGIFFNYEKNEIHLSKSNIISVTKAVRFTFTDRFWLILTYFNEEKNKKDRVFFINEPEINFLDFFKNLGVKLKNVP